MKIAYIYYLYATPSIGVLNKTQDQNLSLIKSGNKTIDIFVLNTEKSGKDGNLTYIKIPDFKQNLYYALSYVFFKYRYLGKKLDLMKYDAVIMRSAGYDATFLHFIKSHNTFLELHGFGDIEAELKLSYQSSIKNAFRKIIKKILIYQYRMFFRKSLDHLKGVVTVSEDVNNFIESNTKLPSLVVPNGIFIDDKISRGFCPLTDQNLKILMVIGRPDVWHGIDRLYFSALRFAAENTDHTIEIHIIGSVKPNDIHFYKETKNVKIKLLGAKQQSEIPILACQFNIAVAPLCLYRKKLNRTSAIKVSEYIKMGIPFVIGYEDFALKYAVKEDCFFLRVPNNEDLMDFRKIFEFAYSVSKNRDRVIDRMRGYAQTYLDWSKILEQYSQFVEKSTLSKERMISKI